MNTLRVRVTALAALIAYPICVPVYANDTLSEALQLSPCDEEIEEFGQSVAIDADFAVVGAEGSAYIYAFDGISWRGTQRLAISDATIENFGRSVAIDGKSALVGASGSAYVFAFDGTRWSQSQEFKASNGSDGSQFGSSVAIDGDVAAVGDPRGAVYIYSFDGTGWRETQKLEVSDAVPWSEFGRSIAFSGNVLIVGASADEDNGELSGAAYIFTFDGSKWSETQKLKASDGAYNDRFGIAVAISGNTAIVGARNAGHWNGAAYVFSLEGSVWREAQKLTAGGDGFEHEFGQAVAIDGNRVLVTASPYIWEDQDLWSIGQLYLFSYDGLAWNQAQVLTQFWGFGTSIAMRSDSVIVSVERDSANVYSFNSQPQFVLRIEAEDMQLETYRIEMLDFPSNGALINLKGSGINGSATTIYQCDDESYDIFVVYHDENDGEAMLTVSIGGVAVDSWVLDQRIPGGEQAEEFNWFTRQIASDFTVNNGDEIRIDGLQGKWDHANVDYIEFRLRQPPAPIRMEAEAMQLVTFKIEALDFASGGALINLKGPGRDGSAEAPFAGASGQYDVRVVYHDENDGVALLSVSIAGDSIDSWALDRKIPGGQQPEEFNRFTREAAVATSFTVNSGDMIRIDGLQGNWDHANVDYVEFVPVP